MGIQFICKACQRKYNVADTFAGKRVKCKACGAAITVPVAEADEVDEVHLPPVAFPTQIAAPVVPTNKLPALLLEWTARLDRIRPRSMWIWLLIGFVGVLGIGLINMHTAMFSFVVLAGGGSLIGAVGAVWAVIVSLTTGSKKLIAAFVASPLLIIGITIRAIARTVRNETERAATTGHSLNFPWYFWPLMLIGGLGMGCVIIGMIADPKAFKYPARMIGMAVVMLVTSLGPFLFHFLTDDQLAASRSYSSSSARPYSSDSPRPAYVPPRPVIPTGPPPTTQELLHPTVWIRFKAQWLKGHVERRMGQWTLVQYDKDHNFEWVEPWRVGMSRIPAGEVPPANPNATWGPDQANPPEDDPSPTPGAQ